jgi:hypothetical protein
LLSCCFYRLVKKTADNKSDDFSIERIKNLNKENKPTTEPSVFDNVNIIALETANDNFIGTVKWVEFCDSIIFIGDLNEKIFAFNSSGKFLYRVGNVGNGPEDYIALSTFFVDTYNKQVVVIDQMKKALIKYGLDGTFRSKVKLFDKDIDPNAAVIYDSQYALLNSDITPWTNLAYKLYDISNGQTMLTKSYYGISVEGYVLDFSKHPMTKFNDELHFIMPLCDTVFSCYDSRFEPKYVIEHSCKMAPIGQYNLTAQKSKTALDFQYIQDGFFTGFTDIFETQEHLLLNYGVTGYNSGYFLANKNSLQGSYHILSTIEDIDNPFIVPENKEITSMPFFKIKTTDGTSFVSVVQPHQLLGLKEQINDKNDSNLTKLKSVIETVKEDDNPLLVFYKLKDN